MPELAAVYAVGFLVCLMLTMLYVFLRERRRHSPAAKCVQTNLAKIEAFWSDSADAILPLTPTSAEDEARRSQRTVGYTGLLLSLLSWGGAFFLLLIMLSERFLARSRREKNLFSSKLAEDVSLNAEAVRRIVQDCDLLNDSPAETARPI